jgi:hypothetical protein
MAKKSTTKKSSAKSSSRSSQKRERINTGSDARFVKRTGSGRFKESDDVGRSQKTDRPRKAKKSVTSGYGDQGDRLKKR